jgi:hypothetical protein
MDLRRNLQATAQRTEKMFHNISYANRAMSRSASRVDALYPLDR